LSRGGGRRPAAVYGIADAELLGLERVEPAVLAMAESGIETIQIRAKRCSDAGLFALCERLLEKLGEWAGELWIDDRADLAVLLPFGGVHLGQADLPPSECRKLLPAATAIGWSTHDRDQLARGEADPDVDWLALGPIHPTTSKRGADPVVGLERLRTWRSLARKPLIAIGGIDADNIAAVLAAGADSAAVLSALCVGDVAVNARRLLRAAA